MATIQRFEDLEVWKKSRVLCNEIFPLTNIGSFGKDYKLRDQINASSGSIMDNISEGFERDSKLEFRQFLSIAKGSCAKFDLNYTDLSIEDISVKNNFKI